MKTFINTLIGLGAFTLIAGVILAIKYIGTNAGLTGEQIGNGLLVVAVLILAPIYGELTKSVYKNLTK
jgi:hypothetical protein